MNPSPAPRFWTTLGRSCRLRCPACGQGRMFGGYFRMHESCDSCGLKFQRGEGYFLGSIYFNYALTALVVVVGYVTMMLVTDLSDRALLVIFGTYCLLFPLWFFRYARSLWRGMDHYFDPTGK